MEIHKHKNIKQQKSRHSSEEPLNIQKLLELCDAVIQFAAHYSHTLPFQIYGPGNFRNAFNFIKNIINFNLFDAVMSAFSPLMEDGQPKHFPDKREKKKDGKFMARNSIALLN